MVRDSHLTMKTSKSSVANSVTASASYKILNSELVLVQQKPCLETESILCLKMNFCLSSYAILILFSNSLCYSRQCNPCIPRRIKHYCFFFFCCFKGVSVIGLPARELTTMFFVSGGPWNRIVNPPNPTSPRPRPPKSTS